MPIVNNIKYKSYNYYYYNKKNLSAMYLPILNQILIDLFDKQKG